tara:strand:+ start:149 stop:382 length:234 start_codon:yes stop_codon:yes gene_type:complete
MRLSLLTLLAAFALPTAANAESVSMIVAGGRKTAVSMLKIEMSSMESCERQGEELTTNRDFRVGVFDEVNYACVKSK